MPKSRRNPVAKKRKNFVVDQHTLDAARQALGLPTDTATVHAALDAVVFRAELYAALDKLAEADVFGSARC